MFDQSDIGNALSRTNPIIRSDELSNVNHQTAHNDIIQNNQPDALDAMRRPGTHTLRPNHIHELTHSHKSDQHQLNEAYLELYSALQDPQAQNTFLKVIKNLKETHEVAKFLFSPYQLEELTTSMETLQDNQYRSVAIPKYLPPPFYQITQHSERFGLNQFIRDLLDLFVAAQFPIGFSKTIPKIKPLSSKSSLSQLELIPSSLLKDKALSNCWGVSEDSSNTSKIGYFNALGQLEGMGMIVNHYEGSQSIGNFVAGLLVGIGSYSNNSLDAVCEYRQGVGQIITGTHKQFKSCKHTTPADLS